MAQPAGPAPDGIEVLPLHPRSPGRLTGRLSLAPRLGLIALSDSVHLLRAAYVDADAVIWAHSYLAAAGPPAPCPTILDLANIETDRFRSLASTGPLVHRFLALLEAAKAARWEPKVLRAVDAVSTLTVADNDWVEGLGARAVLCPNGGDLVHAAPSRDSGRVACIGSFGYRPNRDAVEWYMRHVLPLLDPSVPPFRHDIVGRNASSLPSYHPDVQIHSDVPDIAPFYEAASVVIAPATSGGGSQVKIAEAVARGRCVVIRTEVVDSLPPSLVSHPLVLHASGPADFARTVARLVDSPEERHRREADARRQPGLPSWDATFAPLVDVLLEATNAPR